MIGRLFRILVGRSDPVDPTVRDQTEEERVAARIRQLRQADNAAYWCRACGRPVHHPQCPICCGKAWARRLDHGGAA